MAYKAIDKALLMTVGTIEPSIAPKVVPSIHQLSSGFAMTISALTSAFIGAVLFNKGEAHG